MPSTPSCASRGEAQPSTATGSSTKVVSTVAPTREMRCCGRCQTQGQRRWDSTTSSVNGSASIGDPQFEVVVLGFRVDVLGRRRNDRPMGGLRAVALQPGGNRLLIRVRGE